MNDSVITINGVRYVPEVQRCNLGGIEIIGEEVVAVTINGERFTRNSYFDFADYKKAVAERDAQAKQITRLGEANQALASRELDARIEVAALKDKYDYAHEIMSKVGFTVAGNGQVTEFRYKGRTFVDNGCSASESIHVKCLEQAREIERLRCELAEGKLDAKNTASSMEVLHRKLLELKADTHVTVLTELLSKAKAQRIFSGGIFKG
jgi:hypothetical protein